MHNRKVPGRDDAPSLEVLERAAPWIVGGLIVVLVALSLLAAVMRAPWTR